MGHRKEEKEGEEKEGLPASGYGQGLFFTALLFSERRAVSPSKARAVKSFPNQTGAQMPAAQSDRCFTTAPLLLQQG